MRLSMMIAVAGAVLCFSGSVSKVEAQPRTRISVHVPGAGVGVRTGDAYYGQRDGHYKSGPGNGYYGHRHGYRGHRYDARRRYASRYHCGRHHRHLKACHSRYDGYGYRGGSRSNSYYR